MDTPGLHLEIKAIKGKKMVSMNLIQ